MAEGALATNVMPKVDNQVGCFLVMNLFKSYRNGYGTLYWVEAKFLKTLKPGGFN